MSAILLGTILVRMATGQAGDPTDPSAENGATDVVIARVIDRRVDRDDADPDWDRRTFTYTLMIEAVEQGAFERRSPLKKFCTSLPDQVRVCCVFRGGGNACGAPEARGAEKPSTLR